MLEYKALIKTYREYLEQFLVLPGFLKGLKLEQVQRSLEVYSEEWNGADGQTKISQ